jgi:hypothetical protein
VSDPLQEARRLRQCPGCWSYALTPADLGPEDWVCDCGEAMTLVDLRDSALAQRVEDADEERANLAQLYDLANERADKAERENELLKVTIGRLLARQALRQEEGRRG